MKDKILADLITASQKIKDSINHSYTSDGRGISYLGKGILAEGDEYITYPGTAEVVRYLLFKEGIIKLDVNLGEEDYECRVTGERKVSYEEFVDYVLRDEKKLKSFRRNLDKILDTP